MKKTVKLFVAALLAAWLCSCDMELLPHTDMSTDSATKFGDIEALRNGTYRQFRYIFSGQYSFWYDYQSNLYTELSSSGNRGGFFARWSFRDNDADIADMWENFYYVVANANLTIEKAALVRPVCTEAQQRQIDIFMGEMYLLRAMTFRQLALRWCRDYEPESASTDFGIPIVTLYDIEGRPSRGSLEQTYTQILSDIGEAKKLLTTPQVADSPYATADAVAAFSAQVALDMHRWDDAIAACRSLYTAYPLVDSAAALQKMWIEDSSTETIFQPAITKNDIVAILRYTDLFGGQMTDEGFFRCEAGYIPEQWVVDLYDKDNDLRVGCYIGREYVNNMRLPDCRPWVLRKFIGNEKLRTAPTVLAHLTQPKVLRVADLYLIEAEALYRSSPSSADALVPLNALRESRGLNKLDDITDDELFAEIRAERMREMVGEGVQMSDLKRWHMGFTRNVQTEEGLIPANIEASVMSVEAENYKMIWPVPSSEIMVNPALKGQQNLGW